MATHVRRSVLVMSAWASFGARADCDVCGMTVALALSEREARAAAAAHRCKARAQ